MLKKIRVRSIISDSKGTSVCSIEPDLDSSFFTEHYAMILQDNQWTQMVYNWTDKEDNEDLINEYPDEVL